MVYLVTWAIYCEDINSIRVLFGAKDSRLASSEMIYAHFWKKHQAGARENGLADMGVCLLWKLK